MTKTTLGNDRDQTSVAPDGTVELSPYILIYNEPMTYPLKFRQQALAIREKEPLTFAQSVTSFYLKPPVYSQFYILLTVP